MPKPILPKIVRNLTPLPEELRLKGLRNLKILDTPEELEYDQLVHLAAQVCGTPISLVSLVDQDRQWFKAVIGLSVKETPRNVSFCSHAIQQPNLFIVENAAEDDRFQDNALVTGAPNIRFYAGLPLHGPDGAALGTLCVIDTEPRILTENQKEALTILGLQVQARLELRSQKSVLELALEENRRLTERLQTTNTMFQTFMDNGPFMSYVKDAEGRFVFYNKGLSDHFEVSSEQWIGKTVHDLFPPELADDYRQHDVEVMAGGATKEFPEITKAPDGDLVNWKSYKFPLHDANGTAMLAGISVDVTRDLAHEQALARANAELERLATTDPLTGLANRRSFNARVEQDFQAAANQQTPLTLILMDVDDFKCRNDELGHAAGDEALAFIGSVLRGCTRATDTAVRLGGEEFGLLMPGLNSSHGVKIARRIQDTLRQHPHAPKGLTMSIGIATADIDTQNWDQLLSHADKAMYKAKTTGKNRIVTASPSTQVEMEPTSAI